MSHWRNDSIRVAIDVSFRELDNSVSATTDGLFGVTKYPAKFISLVQLVKARFIEYEI